MKSARSIFQSLRTRARTGILIEGAAVLAAALLVYVFGSYFLDRSLRLESGFRFCLLGILAFAAARIYLVRVHRPSRFELSDDEIALAVERQDPQIRESLISAVQFDRALEGSPSEALRHGESTHLMRRVIGDVEQRMGSIAFHRALDRTRIRRYTTLLGACLLVVVGWFALFSSEALLWARRNLAFSDEPWPRDTHLAFLDFDLAQPYRLAEREDLTVRVRATGVVPDKVFLYCEFADGETAEQPMDRTGEDLFSTTLESLLEDAVVSAWGGDGATGELHIELVPRPRITDMELTLSYPEYLGKEPENVSDTGGDIRVPRGGAISIVGTSSKPLRVASLDFAQEQTAAAQLLAGGTRFQATFAPEKSGVLRIDVLDHDDLGANQPPQLYLRLVEDATPQLDFKTDGIGTLITSVARIPGVLKIRDDYGLVGVEATFQVSDASPSQDGERPEQSPPEHAEVGGLDLFVPGPAEFEGNVLFDLKPLSPDADPQSENNRVRPGHIVGLRFSATDNFSPEAHVGESETLNFRVVTREKLLQELRRRQMEQRRELERVLTKEVTAKGELAEIISPAEQDPRVTQARLRILALARQQHALGKKAKGIADRYRQILNEMQNNRLFEPNVTRALEAKIVSPLVALALDDFPTSAEATAAFADSGEAGLRSSLIGAYEEIIAVIRQVLAAMEKTEDIAAIVETLRIVIRTEQQATDLVERLRNAEGVDIFGGQGSGKPDPDRDKRKEKNKE